MDEEVTEKKIAEVAEKIAEVYKPEKIILFGSYAWGEPHKDSDVDLLIIKKTDDARKIAMEIDGSIFPRPFSIDLLVLTPESVERERKAGDFFIADILTKGKVLYAK